MVAGDEGDAGQPGVLEMLSHQPPQANSVGGYRSFLLHATPVQNDAGTAGGDGSSG
jgi:hypothetical protein